MRNELIMRKLTQLTTSQGIVVIKAKKDLFISVKLG